MDGSWWRGLTECGPLEKGMANHFSILALRTPWTIWKNICIVYKTNFFSHRVMSDSSTPWTVAHQASLSFIISHSLLNLIWWISDAVQPSHSVAHFPSCPQSFPASGSFPMSWLFTSDGQTTGTSASVFPMNIQGWFPLGLTGLISLLSKGLSRVFSSTTVQKHKFFGAQPSLWSNSYICTWLLEKP